MTMILQNPHLKYEKGILHLEGYSLEKAAAEYGTPLYVYSRSTIIENLLAYKNSVKLRNHIICFAMKSNPLTEVLRIAASLDCGCDIVSGGELFLALKAGIRPDRIVFSGVGKTDEEIRFALDSEILLFSVESEEELIRLSEIACEKNKIARVSIRVNPEVDPKTHPYISTGLKANKFGVPSEDVFRIYEMIKKMSHIEAAGIGCHIGSQITDQEVFREAVNRIRSLIVSLKQQGTHLRYVDMGGGLGIRYKDEVPPDPSSIIQMVYETLADNDITCIFEPGRSVSGSAGLLIGRVLYRKKNGDKNFIISNIGMNDLLRPSLYSAYHEVISLKENTASIFADLVGPVCESGDFIAKDRELPDLKRDDLFAVLSAGAYGSAMSSNYNSRQRAAGVMIHQGSLKLIKRRETYEDLLQYDL